MLAVTAVLVAVAWELLRRLVRPLVGEVEEPLYFPAFGLPWETVDPATAGWDVQALEEALDLAGRRFSTGVVLLQGGRILAERYWDGTTADTTRDIFSAQKSVTSILIGIARREGRLELDDAVTRWL
jgi:CubicO group peptidase (beta-lactamase class C family)